MTSATPSVATSRARTAGRRFRRLRGITVGLAAIVGTAAVVAGCGAAATPVPRASVTPTSSPSATGTAAPTAAPAASVAINQLNVTSREYAFDLPASAPAGLTTVSLKNAGTVEHQAQIARLNANATMEQLQAALKNPDPSGMFALITFAGGPTGVAPGATVSTTSNLSPGQYVFLCFIEAADGLPHLAKGQVAPLTVTGTASTADVPTGALTVRAKDFSFEIPTAPLKAGKHALTLVNDGPQPHEATFVKLPPGVTVDQLKQMLSATPAPTGTAPAGSPAATAAQGGTPPWTSAGGIAALSAGTKANFEVDVAAGTYAFLCFVPDPASGRPHFQLGMISGLTVQ